jgi:hypothetical protein
MSSLWRELLSPASPRPTWLSQVLPAGRLLPGDDLGVPGIGFLALTRSPEPGVVLLVQPGLWVRVNGLPILGGIRLLGHKDEILLPAGRMYLSMESTPGVVPFRTPPAGRAPICPICRGPVRDGQEAVQCPGCTRWFHQITPQGDSPGKPCWTYAPTCRFCNHPTPLDSAAAWRPDREECLVS